MNDKERVAMQQALEYCEDNMSGEAAHVLKLALAEQAEQEPVAWGCVVDGELEGFVPTSQKDINRNKGVYETPLYAAPVRTKDLTEYELDELRFQNLNYLDYARAVIAADREKNK